MVVKVDRMANGKPCLLKWQYDELNAQYGNTPPIAEGTGEGGQHCILMNLLNGFGFIPNSRDEAMQIADELLAEGWREEKDA